MRTLLTVFSGNLLKFWERRLPLKGQWWGERSQYQKSLLLSSNVDQSHPYLQPCHLLNWRSSGQRWKLSVFSPADAESIFIRSGLFSRGAGTALNQQCSVGEGEFKGKINDSEIREASGLAYSRRSEKVAVFSEDWHLINCHHLLSMIPIQVLWVHNDSGGGTWINAISEHGESLAKPNLWAWPGRRLADVELQGTTCLDWEDIAVNMEDGISYIYLADIGDNFFVRYFTF